MAKEVSECSLKERLNEKDQSPASGIRPNPSPSSGRHWLSFWPSHSWQQSIHENYRDKDCTEGSQGRLAPYQKVQGPMSKRRETQRVRIPKLNSVGRVGAEIALIYSWARTEKMTPIEAHRLTQVLLGLKACLETSEIEKRMELLEQALLQRDRPAQPLRLISNE
jgi:hypothetical protein